MPGKLITSLVKRLRQVAASFSEKPQVKVDDYVLEHFMLYHGLVGSMPENLKSFKDVKADIKEALANGSSLQLAIALKLPPLWWDDKLKSIFAEFDDKKAAVRLLLPDRQDDWWPNDHEPLGHSDWQVRANAAMLLSFLEASEAAPRMARCLTDAALNAKPAVCHVAYALGELDTADAREALRQFLYNEEPWFRVDAAGALSRCEDQSILEELMAAMMAYHEMRDYMAVAIGRKRKPKTILAQNQATLNEGACAVVLGILDAARQTFNNDIVLETETHNCYFAVKDMLAQEPSPLKVRAARELATWLKENYDHTASKRERELSLSELAEFVSHLETQDYEPLIKRSLAGGADDHAVKLAGELKLESLAPELLALIDKDSPLIEPVVEALGRLGDTKAVDPLLKLARSVVDLQERTAKAASKHPVQEENSREAKIYWRVLEALGNLPAPDSISFLLEATGDYAPDKREQALNSLISCCRKTDWARQREAVQGAIERAFEDSSPQVIGRALEGMAALELLAFTERAVALINSRQSSLSRQAQQSLSDLAGRGHVAEVKAALEGRLKKESDQFRKQRLQQFLQSVG